MGMARHRARNSVLGRTHSLETAASLLVCITSASFLREAPKGGDGGGDIMLRARGCECCRPLVAAPASLAYRDSGWLRVAGARIHRILVSIRIQLQCVHAA